ncbi:MAG: hypothetical protein Kow00128_03560 [Deltaproteobacteria bacterium]
MEEQGRSILSNILRKQIDVLGYPSLAKFHAHHRETIGCSYELARQVIHEGRVPRADTLLAILSALRFSPAQTQKILELCYPGFPRPVPDPRLHSPVVPAEETGRSRRDPEERATAETDGPGPSPVGSRAGEGPGEILRRLNAFLPRIPEQGNEDFWDTLNALAGIAERKAHRLARHHADQPLLFGSEPEAVYHLLLRKGSVPSFMAKGETVPLAFAEGIEYRDRFRGALVGSAIGEVLGRLTQGLSPGDVQALFGRIDSFPPRPCAEAPPPSCLLLARVLLREKRLDPAVAAHAYAAEASVENAGGAEFRRNLLERGYPWFEAGTPESSGSPAARSVPLALLRAGDSRRLKLEAGIDAAITHPSPVSIAGSIAQATAIARLLHTPAGTLDGIGFARSLSHAVTGIEPDRGGRGKAGRPVPTLWRRLGTELTALLLRRAEIEEIREILGNGKPVLEGIPFSWACVLRTPDDFAEAVLSAVNLGNQAEANGALAGGLAGAYLGVSGIPEALLRGFPWRQEAEAAADALLALARRGATAS